MHPNVNYFYEGNAKMQEMQELRQQVADRVDSAAANRIGGRAAIPGDPEHWIDTEDFGHFARALRRPIGVIVAGGGFRFFDATGIADDPTQFTLENFVNRLNIANNPLVVYLELGHYQTVTEVRAPGATWPLPPSPAPQAPVDDPIEFDWDIL
jgi:hypothetical protein